MPYLEIYPIENSAEKIAKQLDLVLDAKPTMYAKTKDRYRKLAHSLLQSVEKISSILEEESLVSNNLYVQDEFDELSENQENSENAKLYQAIQSLTQQVSGYSQFASATPATLDSSSGPSNKEVFARYAEVLRTASEHQFSCIEATECAQLLYRWFRYRFLDSKHPKFKYNLNEIDKWITYFIVLYGKYQSLDRLSDFRDMLNRWCSDVETNPNMIWAVPYEIHNLSKTDCPEDFTLNAVVLGDILVNEHLYLLLSPYFKDSTIDIGVASVVKWKNPLLIPQIRVRLSKQKELMQKCNLTPTYSNEINTASINDECTDD